MRYLIAGLLCVLLAASCSSTGNNTSKLSDREKAIFRYADTINGMSHGKDLEHTDPGILFAYSFHLFYHGGKDEAVYWFYLAELRAKYLAAVILHQGLDNCNPLFIKAVYNKMGGQGEPLYVNKSRIALYGLIIGNFEPVINDYIFSDIDKYVRIANEVIDYERSHPLDAASLLTARILKPEEQHKTIHEEVITKFANLVKWASDNKEKIREKRRQNGLPVQ